MVGATAVMSNIRPPRTATTQAVLRRLAPDTADQQSAVQVGGQVMIGNSGSSHAGSLGPSFVRSWSIPGAMRQGLRPSLERLATTSNMLDFCSTYWTLMPDTADVPAIRRAHDILRTLAAQPPGEGLRIDARLRPPRSTLYLLLDSLEQRRWIERREGGYIVGIELMALGAAYLRHDSRRPPSTGSRRNCALQRGGATGGAGRLRGGLPGARGRRPVRLVSDLGLRLPAHACALGGHAGRAGSGRAGRAPARRAGPSHRAHWPRPRRCAANWQEVRRDGLAQDREEVAAAWSFAAYGRDAAGQAAGRQHVHSL